MDRIFNKSANFKTADLREGGIFLVDKPLGWTSFDVINKLRYSIRKKLGVKKYKIGHAGTLDPLATGLLVVCFSKYTKIIDQLIGQDKCYNGEFTLYATTPCYDAELLPDTYFPRKSYTIAELTRITHQFMGPIDQFPPMYSAVKKQGVPLYALARQGKKVELEPRRIEIYSFDITDISLPRLSCTVCCSKGTYIRSLAHDFGKALGNGGYLSALRRQSVGDYHVNQAWSVDQLVQSVSHCD